MKRRREKPQVPADLSIQHVPDELADRLRRADGSELLSLAQALAYARHSGLRTPSESVAMNRADRARDRRVER
jgi:hypothetical protein